MNSPPPQALDVDKATRVVDIESGPFPVLDHGQGPVVLLLHGFPDSRRLWRYQAPALADNGFRVVAPDMRGFGDAPKPEGVGSYAERNARGDVRAILKGLDISEYRVVGHDWGSSIAWILAANYPDEVEQLAVLSVGHGRSDSIEQWERSWYFWFFQCEGAAEKWLRRDDWHLLREWLREEGDFDRYIEDLSRPGALTAVLNWYRANITPGPPMGTGANPSGVTCPVLGVWSDGDHHLTEEQMIRTEALVDGP